MSFIPKTSLTVRDMSSEFIKDHFDGVKQSRTLRFSEIKDGEGLKTGTKALSFKEHGIFAKAIRFFGGPTKQDMVENFEIKSNFREDFCRQYPVLGDKILAAAKLIKWDSKAGEYRFTNLKPLTFDQIVRLEVYGKKYDDGFDPRFKDFLKILP